MKKENNTTQAVLTRFISSRQMYSVKKVLLEISQNSQKNACARVSFLIKLPRPATLIKKRLGLQLFLKRDWQRCFPVNFSKFL